MKQGWNDFITAFQFLTRILLFTNHESTQESFGRSVKFFPLIGGIVGLILAGAAYGIHWLWCGNEPRHALILGLVAGEIFLTGGLHWDGFMDTMDGIFSGRSRERMLEIMKDSRVGSFGAIALCLMILARYSLFMDLTPDLLFIALFVMPVVGRCGIVLAVTFFAYARPEGMGKVFPQHATYRRFYIAMGLALLLVLPLGKIAWLGGAVGLFFATGFARYVNRRLGGLTGDVYGAVNEVTELMVLVAILVGGPLLGA